MTAKRFVALIVNPFASGVDDERVREVERALGERARVTTLRTRGREHATELAREASTRRDDAIVVFAGDGGYNEVLNGLDGATPVGFIPGGGSSVLPRALGLPRDHVAAARTLAASIAAGRTKRISLGRVNGRRFGFSAGIGLDAELVRRVDALGRPADGRRPGDAAFLRELAALIRERRGRLRPALEVAGVGRAAFAVVVNGNPYTYLGPLPVRVAPAARFELGLDLVAPVDIRARDLARLLGNALLGRDQTGSANILHRHDVERIEVFCDAPTPLQADGEDLGDVESAVFEAERGAVSVLV